MSTNAENVGEVVERAACGAIVKRASAKKLFLASAALMTIAASAAESADLPTATPKKVLDAAAYYDWTGLYVGGHFGYGMGTFGPGTNPILSQAVIFPPTFTGFVGGFQAGYNFHLPNNVVLGLEADISFPSPIDKPATGISPFNTTFDYFGTARARFGYAFGSVLPYVTAGVAWGQTKVNINDTDGNVVATKSATQVGWTAGAGIEYALIGNWTAKVEYNYIDLGTKTYSLDIPAQPTLTVDPKVHIVKLGLNYRLGDIAPWGSPDSLNLKKSSVPDSDDWSIHGQTTFIEQGYGHFHSPYQGQNSLPGGGQGRETSTATAFIGWRLWEGGEFYFNPELAQGFGLARTLGLGGFSNGEAEKAGTEFPKTRAQRYFLRQTFGLGGEQETVDDGPNQLAGKRDIDRITLTVGRFAVGDIFDANTYAHDPRADFMNWAMWSSAAYDFPADLPGFTRGAVIELNRKDWAIRAGWFQVPEEPNSDVLVFKTGGAVVELEERYSVFEQPGKLRVGVFANWGNTGSYREALAIASTNPSIDINDAMVGIRQNHLKYGFYVNAEQAITKDVGVFARVSWNDGHNEILSFTDIDRSVSGGVSIKGSSWGRPNDTVGLGGAINGLSGPHRDFLAAGGLGLLIGDGQLNYSLEKIIETYYAISVAKWATLAFNYQFITDPAYNADRGPVSIFAMRLHAEF
jgi:high affinity Mn2+ porin